MIIVESASSAFAGTGSSIIWVSSVGNIIVSGDWSSLGVRENGLGRGMIIVSLMLGE